MFPVEDSLRKKAAFSVSDSSTISTASTHVESHSSYVTNGLYRSLYEHARSLECDMLLPLMPYADPLEWPWIAFHDRFVVNAGANLIMWPAVLAQGEGSMMRRCYFDPVDGQHKGGNSAGTSTFDHH